MIRELKCPYGDDFEGGDECDRCEQYELCMETYPPLNLIEIPKNATNGDMIRIVFPNIESRLDEKTGVILVKWADGTTKTFKESWWNAPYKRGAEND